MRRDVLGLDSSFSSHFTAPDFTLADVEAVRLALSGGSIIDWQRLAFESVEQVDHFLSLHQIDISDPEDRERLRYVYNEAVAYLEEHLHLSFSAELRDPQDVRDVFIWASSRDGAVRRRQNLACVILKLMHVIHHMEAADLKFKLAISEERLFELAEARILKAAREMRESGLQVISFYGSRKTRSSVITKLIAKKENLAATIFDKLRFRIVVERPEDLPDSLAWLTRELFPFNYVIPGESFNNLLDPSTVVERLPDREERLQAVADQPIRTNQGKNEFSGKSYRMINFIVDFPVRVTELPERGFSCELGRVVYVMVEFQLLDEATARRNEEGDNSHYLYKLRQNDVVARRLRRGGETKEG